MDTLSVEQFEQVVGKALSQAVHRLMSMTGAQDPRETNVKMTVVYQRLAQQLGMVEEAIIEKTVRETKTPHPKVREMLKQVRMEAEVKGKAFIREKYEERLPKEEKLVQPVGNGKIMLT